MPPLTCPRCATVADFAPGVPVVCPACGYPGPDQRAWQPSPVPPPPSGAGKMVGIVVGVVGGVIALTVILAAVVFVLVSNVSPSDSPLDPAAAPFEVKSARIAPGSCGNATGTCHVVTVLIHATNRTGDFNLACCWSGIDMHGGGYDALPLDGQPDYIVKGSDRQVELRFALADASERLKEIRYEDYYAYEPETESVPPY